MEIITSVQNDKVKHAASLHDKKGRRFSGTFLVEGYKLVREVLCGAMEVECLYVEQSVVVKYADLISQCDNVYALSSPAFQKICYTESSQGIIAEVKMKPTPAPKFDEPFIVLDTIQDPGNLGTIIRTAAALDFKEIVLINCADPFSPKVVRASSGGIFYLSTYQLTYDEFVEELKGSNAKVYIADMNGENVFKLGKIDENYCLVVGSEGQGVGDGFRGLSDRVISLPMNNLMESLNASVSASVIMYQLKKDMFD